MYAIVKTGGKQLKVAVGDVVNVERMVAGEAPKAGAKVTLDSVMLVSDNGKISVGAPLIKGASVAAEVVEERKGEKQIVFKNRRRKSYRRLRGHRQLETLLKITAINVK